MRELVADRFVPIGETWTDVACGAPVRLRFLPAASRVDEIVWNDQCAERTRLRHPLLNVLVDYGVADPQRRFEAYGVGAPIRASGRMAAHLLRHAARFLESHGLPLLPQTSRVALRDVCGALGRLRPDLGRPLGLVLQPRSILDGLAEALDVVNRSTGPLGIEIAGANGSGIRTTRLLAARLARIAGLVPIASAAGCTDAPFEGFHVSHFVIELTLLIGAMVARQIFRFPLFVLLATGSAWFFVTDVLSSGGDWSATVTLVFGLTAMLFGVTVDRVYGFWVHVVAGLTVGGAWLWFSHSSDADWILIGLASLVFVSIASGLGRSSYAVLGAFGLLLVTTHFVVKWFVTPFIPFFGDSESGRVWAAALKRVANLRGARDRRLRRVHGFGCRYDVRRIRRCRVLAVGVPGDDLRANPESGVALTKDIRVVARVRDPSTVGCIGRPASVASEPAKVVRDRRGAGPCSSCRAQDLTDSRCS